MYDKLAPYYDLLYSWKNYSKEVVRLQELIGEYKKSKGKELLEIACGTGNHSQYLQKEYTLTGMDLNQGMLEIARKKCPQIKFLPGDMMDFSLEKKFDIILCLFSSIAYVRTYRNLKKTIACFTRHLKQGGVMIIEPFFTSKDFIPNSPHAQMVDQKDLKLVRMCVSRKKGYEAILDFHFLLATKDGVQHYRDLHRTALFEVDKFLAILRGTGLEATFLENGLMDKRGLYVATL